MPEKVKFYGKWLKKFIGIWENFRVND